MRQRKDARSVPRNLLYFWQLAGAESEIPGVGTMKQRKQEVLKRLARLEGQVRGVVRMVEEDRYCVDILNQTLAIRSALAQVEILLIQDHSDHCVEEAIASSDPQAQRLKFRELVDLFEKISR